MSGLFFRRCEDERRINRQTAAMTARSPQHRRTPVASASELLRLGDAVGEAASSAGDPAAPDICHLGCFWLINSFSAPCAWLSRSFVILSFSAFEESG